MINWQYWRFFSIRDHLADNFCELQKISYIFSHPYPYRCNTGDIADRFRVGSGDVDDVILNYIGGALGYSLWKML
jgi:hypothetical protein